MSLPSSILGFGYFFFHLKEQQILSEKIAWSLYMLIIFSLITMMIYYAIKAKD